MVTSFQKAFSDVKTAYERRKQKSFRKALVPFGDLVMFMPVEKPKDKGEARYRDGVIGTTEPSGSRLVSRSADAAYSKSMRGAPWQPSPAEPAEGEPSKLALFGVPMVAVENRPAVPVRKPRDYKARRFCILREVELAKYGVSDDCEGCHMAQLGAEAKPQSEGCREGIGHANDELCSGPAEVVCGGAASLAGEQQSVATRVEAAQEGPDEAMRQDACCEQREKCQAPRFEVSREDSTRVSSRKGGRVTVLSWL